MRRWKWWGIGFLVLCAIVLAGFLAPGIKEAIPQIVGSATSPRGLVSRVRVLSESGGRVCWSPLGDWIAMDRTQEDGYYDLFLIRPDGSESRCLTEARESVLGKGNHGQPAWHPSGRYLAFQSQKADGVGKIGRDIASQPGLGKHSDLWLMDLEKQTFHSLVRTPDGDDSGILHSHFSSDGQRLSWSACHSKGKTSVSTQAAGLWRLMVADFSLGPEGPKLANFQEFEPLGPGFYENHGFSRDGKKLVFTSNSEAKSGEGFLRSTRIYQLDLESQEVEPLAEGGYNETAHYTPSGRHIVWMTSRENPNRGTDYWVMQPDGRQKRRITDFNHAENPGYASRLVVAADHSFAPDGTRFAAYLQTNLIRQIGVTVVVDLDLEKIGPL